MSLWKSQAALRDPAGRLPDMLGGLSRRMDRRPRLLTPVVGPLQRSFSGISWYLGQAALKENVVDAVFALSAGQSTARNLRLHISGGLWKFQRLIEGKKFRGFKFHPAFHDMLWSKYLPVLDRTIIINNTQLFGPYFLQHYQQHDVTPIFYIDGTLTEYFGSYAAVNDSVVAGVGADVRRRAIELEREGYAHAAHIVAMSQATARNLVEEYGVSPARVSVVMPGANVDDEVIPPPSAGYIRGGGEFLLGFVGLYPLRKGLDKLAHATAKLRARDVPVRLRVIGRCPDEIAAMDGVDYLGPIDKSREVGRFIAAIRSVHLGCQLSRAELTGIAMMEFLRVGVPIMATNIGGMPDVIQGGGGVLVPADITVDQLVEELASLINDTEMYKHLRQAAISRSEWASWRRAVLELNAVLASVE